ncbi:MAG: hypothetical protein WBZ29_08675, partial [Methanocella sp.]
STDSPDTHSRCCSRGPRRIFLAEGPSHAKLCEGCGGGRAMNAAEGALLSACEALRSAPPKAQLAGDARVRARPGRRST